MRKSRDATVLPPATWLDKCRRKIIAINTAPDGGGAKYPTLSRPLVGLLATHEFPRQFTSLKTASAYKREKTASPPVRGVQSGVDSSQARWTRTCARYFSQAASATAMRNSRGVACCCCKRLLPGASTASGGRNRKDGGRRIGSRLLPRSGTARPTSRPAISRLLRHCRRRPMGRSQHRLRHATTVTKKKGDGMAAPLLTTDCTGLLCGEDGAREKPAVAYRRTSEGSAGPSAPTCARNPC